MATLIKDTPILRGKDAKRFLENLHRALNPTEEELKERLIERERIRKSYEALEAIKKF